MTFEVRQLKAGLGFGREVLGLDRSDISKNAVRSELRNIWLNDGLVVFRGSDVTPDFLIELSQVFGETEVHPVPELRDPDYPQLMRLVSRADDGLFEVDGVQCVGYLPWHSDLVFSDRINRGGVLTACSITSWGGETGFIDQVRAYELLPDDMKRRVEDLEVVYQLCVNPAECYGLKSEVRTLRMSEYERKVGPRVATDFPPVVHPLVFVQPETGRKVLNLSPIGARYIFGHDDAAGHALLLQLVDHLQSCATYFHSWKPSEMILWDNWRMVHSVTGAPADEVRIVQRTTIMGDYGLGRKLADVA